MERRKCLLIVILEIKILTSEDKFGNNQCYVIAEIFLEV